MSEPKCELSGCAKPAAANKRFCSYVHYVVWRRDKDGSLKNPEYLLDKDSEYGRGPEVYDEALRLGFIS